MKPQNIAKKPVAVKKRRKSDDRNTPRQTVDVAKKTGTQRNPANKSSEFSLEEAKRRLSGSRFRTLNEMLYSSDSDYNWSQYALNPGLFDIYHEGYKEQVSQWPFNPVDKIIAWLEELEDHKIIGDFGCGEALIAQTFPNRIIYSFDLVAKNKYITACNIRNVPLASNSLDVAIFCLSLMGKDWPLFILEAARCLRKDGILKIAEVQSRFTNIDDFMEFVTSLGFSNPVRIDEAGYFMFFEFRLRAKFDIEKFDTEELQKHSHLLSACLYKRR